MQRLLDILAGRGDDGGLDRAALELARIEYPELEAEPFIALLDSYAAELGERLGGRAGGAGYVAAADEFLFGELGFSGNKSNYYDPRNSCLNDVLMARTGLPITLAVVYLEIARRLSQPVYGIGLPGHFVVEYRSAEYATFIDVFQGGQLLTAADCYTVARRESGMALADDPAMLEPVSNRLILARMLRNLRAVYFTRRAYGKALGTLDLLLAADPQSAEEYKQRGIVQMQLRNAAAARKDLETYLRLAPEAPDRSEVEQHLARVRSYQAGMN